MALLFLHLRGVTTPFGDRRSLHRLADGMAITAACLFTILAAYRIDLPGLYYDEVTFVNAAQGAPDNTFIYLRLGRVPILIMQYLGALKAWLYAPIFRFFGVSALTIRLPAILLSAITLLIFYGAIRDAIGSVWAATVVWIMALDPANLFPSRLDWGPTVLMHFFQALILALWWSYCRKPQFWKPMILVGCFALGFFDKFNFVWLILAFIVGIVLCYPERIRTFWSSFSKFSHRLVIAASIVAFSSILYLILPLLHFQEIKAHLAGIYLMWVSLISALSGLAVAHFIFASPVEVNPYIPFWLIVTDTCLGVALLVSPRWAPAARENRQHGFFCLLIGFLIFVQIVITPQAGGPHHYSMILPLPLLAFAFFAKSLYQITSKRLQPVTGVAFGIAAMCICVVNVHNTGLYLAHFRNNLHYNPRWSPEIYALSEYVNQHGWAANRIISIDWGLHTQLHALAPKKLRKRMWDSWPLFRRLGQETQQEQSVTLRRLFGDGKNFVLTFAASKETFPETRRNFLALLDVHPELKFRLVKEFWFGGEKVYELYEVTRGQT